MAVFANDLIGITINVFGVYEKEELDTLFDFLQPLRDVFSRGVALDIGANIGNHTLYFSRRFRFVHAFEPNPTTYYLLKFNVSGLPNALAHNVGLGDEKGVFKLFENPTNAGGSTIVSGETTEDAVDVVVERLDDCELDRDGLCFIKLDVEAFEANVIRGGSGVISRHEPLIVMEQHASEFIDDTTPSISLLKDLGYRFCWHQAGTDSRNWLLRRLFNVGEIFLGRSHRIVTGERVPKGEYSLLIAVPPRFQETLGLS